MKQDAAVLVKTRPHDESSDRESDPDESIKACARDLIDAVHAHDEGRAASALRSAFQILDAEPHEEGENTNEPEQENE